MDDVICPKEIKVNELTDTRGQIVIEPLEQGFAMTIGNSLRRTLLSAIPGAAVVRIRFAGKYHEFDTIEGIEEDVLEIILNLKGLALRLPSDDAERLTLEKKGPAVITGADFNLPPGVELINPEHHIATLNARGKLDVDVEVETGFGYVPAETNRLEDSPLSVIPIDADFSPVRQVNITVEDTRVGGKTGYERLVLDLETDGGIRPEEALSESSRVLQRHFDLFKEFSEHPFGLDAGEAESLDPTELSIPLASLDIDQRACNLFQEADITTLSELLRRPREELLDIHGFGGKTLAKVEDRLLELGYALKSEGEMGDAT